MTGRHSHARQFAALSGLTALAVAAVLVGCEDRSMYDQARYDPYEPSPLFDNGTSARRPVYGTVARDDADEVGASDGAAVTMALLRRGRVRFNIWCAPCHGLAGYGDGPVAAAGYPTPPSYHTDRLRRASDAHLMEVIERGLGKMPGYGRHVPPADRWAIVNYIRALQLSQHAPLEAVPAERRGRLSDARGEAPPRGGRPGGGGRDE